MWEPVARWLVVSGASLALSLSSLSSVRSIKILRFEISKILSDSRGLNTEVFFLWDENNEYDSERLRE